MSGSVSGSTPSLKCHGSLSTLQTSPPTQPHSHTPTHPYYLPSPTRWRPRGFFPPIRRSVTTCHPLSRCTANHHTSFKSTISQDTLLPFYNLPLSWNNLGPLDRPCLTYYALVTDKACHPYLLFIPSSQTFQCQTSLTRAQPSGEVGEKLESALR